MIRVHFIFIKNFPHAQADAASEKALIRTPLSKQSLAERASIVQRLTQNFGVPQIIFTSFDKYIFQTAEPFINYFDIEIHNGQMYVFSLPSLKKATEDEYEEKWRHEITEEEVEEWLSWNIIDVIAKHGIHLSSTYTPIIVYIFSDYYHINKIINNLTSGEETIDCKDSMEELKEKNALSIEIFLTPEEDADYRLPSINGNQFNNGFGGSN